MDIEILSQMIRSLIVEHDKVGLPSVGVFVSEFVPASFSDKGFAINPPYRRLSFYQGGETSGDDGLLVDLFAKSNSLETQKAREQLESFLSELTAVLKERKTVVFPGLGRLRATRENNFFFVPDESLDIFPEGFALETVSLKSLSPSEIATDISREFAAISATGVLPPSDPRDSLPSPSVDEDSPQPRSDEASLSGTESKERDSDEGEHIAPHDGDLISAKSESEVLQNSGDGYVGKRKKTWLWIVIAMVVATGLALGVFLLLCHTAPDFIDSLLYTPEELRIINY